MYNKLAHFTEVMRNLYFCKEEETDKAIKALSNFLKQISLSDLKEITRESQKGSTLLVLKSNPEWIEGFVRNLNTGDNDFCQWISGYSRSWALLN